MRCFSEALPHSPMGSCCQDPDVRTSWLPARGSHPGGFSGQPSVKAVFHQLPALRWSEVICFTLHDSVFPAGKVNSHRAGQ